MYCRVPFILLCSLSLAFSQSSKKTVKKTSKAEAPAHTAPGVQAWPVGELHVEGNKIYRSEQILALTGMKIGQSAGKAEFDAARDRLLATGAFESVGYRFDPMPGKSANSGVFKVEEVNQLFPYRFEELHTDEKALRAQLQAKEPLFGDKIPATQPVLDRMTAEVQSFLKRPDAIVAKLEGIGDLTLVFRPATLPSIAEVTFTGNKALSTTALQQAIAGAAIGMVYTDSRVRQILDGSIRPVYEREGYLRVEFPSVDVAPAKGVNGIALNVNVKEGEVYKLSAVELKGELAANKELLKIGKFRTGDTVNFDQVKNGVEEIRLALRRKGYMEAKVTHERKIDDAKKEVSVTVDPDPGPEFTMGKLTIEGLDIETEPHIRKLWALKKGQAFNVEYPNYFLARLAEDQVLDNLGKTSTTIVPNPETNTVDVTIVLKGEQKPKEKRDLP